MKINIPLPCPSCGGKMYSVNYESSFTILKKEDDKFVRSMILKGMQMSSRKQFAALEHKTCYF
jgi:transposase-like protein